MLLGIWTPDTLKTSASRTPGQQVNKSTQVNRSRQPPETKTRLGAPSGCRLDGCSTQPDGRLDGCTPNRMLGGPAAQAGHLYSCLPPPTATGVKGARVRAEASGSQQGHDHVPLLSPNRHLVCLRRKRRISLTKYDVRTRACVTSTVSG